MQMGAKPERLQGDGTSGEGREGENADLGPSQERHGLVGDDADQGVAGDGEEGASAMKKRAFPISVRVAARTESEMYIELIQSPAVDADISKIEITPEQVPLLIQWLKEAASFAGDADEDVLA